MQILIERFLGPAAAAAADEKKISFKYFFWKEFRKTQFFVSARRWPVARSYLLYIYTSCWPRKSLRKIEKT